jgi:guanine deaminase
MAKTRIAEMKKELMAQAIREASRGVRRNHGGPFGAVVVQQGVILARAHNQVIKNNDPTAHAEVLAIRRAARKLARFNLSDCELYSTCEPCPMCLAALHWARISKIYYGCTRLDAAAIGFDDNLLYQILSGQQTRSRIDCQTMERDACLKLFEQWSSISDRPLY